MPESALGTNAYSPVDVLRYSLERRQFSEVSTLELSDATRHRDRHVVLFEATSFMETEPETLRDVVTSLLGALHSADIEFLLWIHGDGRRLRFYFGSIAPAGATQIDPRRAEILEQSLEGFLRGARLARVPGLDDLTTLRDALEHRRSVASLVGIPSDRAEGKQTARIDEALEGLAFRDFDLIVQCAAATDRDIDLATANLSHIAAMAHRLARTTESRSTGANLSKSITEGVSATIGASETKSWSTGKSESTAEQSNAGEAAVAQSIGILLGAAIGGIVGGRVGGSAGRKRGTDLGVQLGAVAAGGLVPPKQVNRGSNTTEATAAATTTSDTKSRSEAISVGTNFARQISHETLDRQAVALEQLAEEHLERFRRGRALGAWSVSVHVCADDDATRNIVSHMLVGALRGDRTHLEKLVALPYARDSVATALRSIRAFVPIELPLTAHPFIPGGEQPRTLLGSNELAQWVMPPSGDVAGVRVDRPVRFARTVEGPSDRNASGGSRIKLGVPTHWGRPNARGEVSIGRDEFTRHVLVAGTTGSGKTTTLRRMLWELASANVPFLVIEPAKSGFGDLRQRMQDAGMRPLRLVLGKASNNTERSLVINPFAAPAGVPLGRHAEAVKILLRSCFEMQESLPQLLERLIFETYADFKWDDLVTPLSADSGRSFPCFSDFFTEVYRDKSKLTRLAATVRRFGYEDRIANSLTAALTVRLESFTRGVKGHIFRREEIDLKEVLSRPCFLELSDLTEPDVRRFLVGTLLLRIYAEREAQRRSGDTRDGLRHVIVLEEAHHVLRSAAQAGPGAALVEQSNLLLTDAFAELREYGQGIVVADQAPGDLVPAVLRNTATKIVHTLFHEADVAAVGDAIGLDVAQRAELRRLRRGECVVSTPEFPAPVTCFINAAVAARKV
jgi:DNA helicase HerA-like ATPase